MATVWNAQLLEAAEKGDLHLLQEALKGGADINAKDRDGNTALIFASVNGYTEIGKVLIAAGADITLHNTAGATARFYASYYKVHTDIIALLENAAKGILPSREEAGLSPPPTAGQAKADRQWQEAEGIRKKLRAGKTDPSEVGF